MSYSVRIQIVVVSSCNCYEETKILEKKLDANKIKEYYGKRDWHSEYFHTLRREFCFVMSLENSDYALITVNNVGWMDVKKILGEDEAGLIQPDQISTVKLIGFPFQQRHGVDLFLEYVLPNIIEVLPKYRQIKVREGDDEMVYNFWGMNFDQFAHLFM